MTKSSETWNYHIRDIVYNIYEDNIFQNNKSINFLSITAPSFIKDTSKFYHCMYLIDDVVKPDHIATLKKQLDKAELICFVMKFMISAS